MRQSRVQKNQFSATKTIEEEVSSTSLVFHQLGLVFFERRFIGKKRREKKTSDYLLDHSCLFHINPPKHLIDYYQLVQRAITVKCADLVSSEGGHQW